MKRKIWTIGYFPMQMGGNVNRPICTEVIPIEEKNVGKSIYAFSFALPNGEIRIAEKSTGGIVGESFEGVIDDVKNSSKKEILSQLQAVKKEFENSYPKNLTNEEFFNLYCSNQTKHND